MGFLKQMIKDLTLFGIWDILDIAVVSYIVYKLIVISRSTAAGRVIKGVILLLCVAQVSGLLGLNLLNFLLVNTLQLGLLALVVLFQPELRRVFEKVGSKRLRLFADKETEPSEIENAITQTVEACKSLSWSRTGALIVFERDIVISSVFKTGTVLDSKVSAELLKNIFFPNTPMHDGALIVRNGRVAAAGCMLPLSTNTNLSKQLGMRHRAGVGMSENSDAVVVVVSEETGSVSVAIGGMLKRHLAPETLEKLLRNELLPSFEEEKQKTLLGLIVGIFTKKKEDKEEEEI